MKKWEGIHKDLQAQVRSITRNAKLGSIKTTERYRDAMDRFTKFLAREYGIRKVRNFSAKHVTSYVSMLKAQGRSSSYIKTEISAIRTIHDLIPDAKYSLPCDNSAFNVDQRIVGKTHRAWSEKEVSKISETAKQENNLKYARAMGLARHAGLRVHEVFRLDRAAAEKALRTGVLTVKGKGGKVRTIPCSRETIKILEEASQGVARGSKLFATLGQTHLQIKDLQTWIEKHRVAVRDEARAQGLKTGSLYDEKRGIAWGDLTFHGLRHAYAQEQYSQRLEEKIAQGLTEKDAVFEAKREVSQLLGHNRIEVVNIYLA